jgi:hypothetical protein
MTHMIPTINPGTTSHDIVAEIDRDRYSDNPRPVKLGRFVLNLNADIEVYGDSERTSDAPTTAPIKVIPLQSVRQFVGRWMADR